LLLAVRQPRRLVSEALDAGAWQLQGALEVLLGALPLTSLCQLQPQRDGAAAGVGGRQLGQLVKIAIAGPDAPNAGLLLLNLMRAKSQGRQEPTRWRPGRSLLGGARSRRDRQGSAPHFFNRWGG
jgi:hypothetical protein